MSLMICNLKYYELVSNPDPGRVLPKENFQESLDSHRNPLLDTYSELLSHQSSHRNSLQVDFQYLINHDTSYVAYRMQHTSVHICLSICFFDIGTISVQYLTVSLPCFAKELQGFNIISHIIPEYPQCSRARLTSSFWIPSANNFHSERFELSF